MKKEVTNIDDSNYTHKSQKDLFKKDEIINFSNRKNKDKVRNEAFSNKNIFSNMVLKKHINEDNKSKRTKISIIKTKNNISGITAYTIKKNKKELKDQSTNTYNSDLLLQETMDNNYYEFDKIHPKNPFVKEIKFDNNNNFNVNNNSIFRKLNNSNENNLITNINKNSENNIFSNSKLRRDIFIDKNNINIFDKSNYFDDIYKYNIMKSIMQNRTNYFSKKGINSFFSQLPRSESGRTNLLYNKNRLNIYSYFNKINNLSLRELYRNLNNDINYRAHFNNRNNKKNAKRKEMIIVEKKFENNKDNYNSFSKKKFNLTNIQYDLDILKHNKNKLKIANTYFKKTNTYLNNLRIIKSHRDKSQNSSSKKKMGNIYKNLLKRNENFKDILDIGLTNSSSQMGIREVKNINHHHSKDNKIEIPKNIIKKDSNKKNLLKIKNIYFNFQNILIKKRKKFNKK